MSIKGVVVVSLLMMLCGCNTMEGLGRDVKKSGESLEGAAGRNKPR